MIFIACSHKEVESGSQDDESAKMIARLQLQMR